MNKLISALIVTVIAGCFTGVAFADFNGKENNSKTISTDQEAIVKKYDIDDYHVRSDAINHLSIEMKRKLKLPQVIPFENIKRKTFEVQHKTVYYPHERILEQIDFGDRGVLEIQAVSPIPKVAIPQKDQVEQYENILLPNGQEAIYQDNGNMQMIKWADKENDIYYWVVGSIDLKDKEKKISKSILLKVISSMKEVQ